MVKYFNEIIKAKSAKLRNLLGSEFFLKKLSSKTFSIPSLSTFHLFLFPSLYSAVLSSQDASFLSLYYFRTLFFPAFNFSNTLYFTWVPNEQTTLIWSFSTLTRVLKCNLRKYPVFIYIFLESKQFWEKVKDCSFISDHQLKKKCNVMEHTF